MAKSIFDTLDRKTCFDDEDQYLAALAKVQKKLLSVQQAYLLQKRRAVIVLEGTDAAGKGGLVRRLTERLDPRFCKVWPIGAPNEVERQHHYLGRFWARLPGAGEIAVFDRSWYGRLLVERVEGLTGKTDWKRAFREIPEFERQLTDDGVRLVKIYLDIDADEQKRRFVDRLIDPMKRWKLTARDFEARRFAGAYRKAAAEMIEETSSKRAPWTVIAGDFKWYARVEALKTIASALSDGIDLTPPPLDPVLVGLARSELGVLIALDGSLAGEA
jgi:polyphosphate kinase 2 (PPK2 family)